MVSMDRFLSYAKGAAPYAIGSSLVSTAVILSGMHPIDGTEVSNITILALTYLGGLSAFEQEPNQDGRLNALKGIAYSAAATMSVLAVDHLTRVAYHSPSNLFFLGAIGALEVGTRVIGAFVVGTGFFAIGCAHEDFMKSVAEKKCSIPDPKPDCTQIDVQSQRTPEVSL